VFVTLHFVQLLATLHLVEFVSCDLLDTYNLVLVILHLVQLLQT